MFQVKIDLTYQRKHVCANCVRFFIVHSKPKNVDHYYLILETPIDYTWITSKNMQLFIQSRSVIHKLIGSFRFAQTNIAESIRYEDRY